MVQDGPSSMMREKLVYTGLCIPRGAVAEANILDQASATNARHSRPGVASETKLQNYPDRLLEVFELCGRTDKDQCCEQEDQAALTEQL